MSYTFTRVLDIPFDQAVDRVTAALSTAGFGVLSDIDVAATMKKKLDRDMRPIASWAPAPQHGVAGRWRWKPRIGAHCAAVKRESWRETARAGRTVLEAIDPVVLQQGVDNPGLVRSRAVAHAARVMDGIEGEGVDGAYASAPDSTSARASAREPEARRQTYLSREQPRSMVDGRQVCPAAAPPRISRTRQDQGPRVARMRRWRRVSRPAERGRPDAAAKPIARSVIGFFK